MKITGQYLQHLDNQFNDKLKGVLYIPRNRYLLRINKVLTKSEYLLYCIIWDVLVDWDDRHRDFGLFQYYSDLLARWTKSSPSSVRRVFKLLCDKNFIIFVSDNKYYANGYELKKRFFEKNFNFYHELKEIVKF